MQAAAMPGKRRWAPCRWRLVPHPRAQPQRFGAHTTCQRASKAPWQRDKPFVRTVAFTPDGKQVLTANGNTTMYLLDCP